VTNRVARRLGDISYGIYLSHLLFVELALTSWHFFPAGNLTAFLRMAGVVTAGSCLVGWASFACVERPLTGWARRRSAQRVARLPAPAGVVPPETVGAGRGR
jgi:peptidoglycan/LPS O-acetylase OafA/YrhL